MGVVMCSNGRVVEPTSRFAGLHGPCFVFVLPLLFLAEKLKLRLNLTITITKMSSVF
jgi:hypothetical protein